MCSDDLNMSTLLTVWTARLRLLKYASKPQITAVWMFQGNSPPHTFHFKCTLTFTLYNLMALLDRCLPSTAQWNCISAAWALREEDGWIFYTLYVICKGIWIVLFISHVLRWMLSLVISFVRRCTSSAASRHQRLHSLYLFLWIPLNELTLLEINLYLSPYRAERRQINDAAKVESRLSNKLRVRECESSFLPGGSLYVHKRTWRWKYADNSFHN